MNQRTRYLLIGACSTLALGTAAALWLWSPSTSTEGTVRTAASAPRSKWLDQWPRNQEELVLSVDELLAEGSPQAWKRLAELYKGVDTETKREILEHAAALPHLRDALAFAVASVGDDVTPPSEDKMIDTVAELLKERWTEPEDLEYGRQMMLQQKTEKRQWVLAKSMITFAAGLPANSAFEQQKGKLSNKLIDLHSSVSDGFIRASIADGMADLGARDVSIVLAQGADVSAEQLDVVKRERAAQAAALRNLQK